MYPNRLKFGPARPGLKPQGYSATPDQSGLGTHDRHQCLGSQLPRTKPSQPVFNRRRSIAGGFIPGGLASGDELHLYGPSTAHIFNRERYTTPPSVDER